MTTQIHRPSDDYLTPLDGLRYFGDAIRGDWGGIDGRTIRYGLDEYIDWAAAQGGDTTEKDVLPALERHLNVYVVEESYDDENPEAVSQRGCWSWHAGEEIAAREANSESTPQG